MKYSVCLFSLLFVSSFCMQKKPTLRDAIKEENLNIPDAFVIDVEKTLASYKKSSELIAKNIGLAHKLRQNSDTEQIGLQYSIRTHEHLRSINEALDAENEELESIQQQLNTLLITQKKSESKSQGS